MNGSRSRRQPLWRRLPRVVYWISGAAVAFLGAVTAQGVSDDLPLEQRLPVWVLGSIFIFLGLLILSLGVKSRLTPEDEDNDNTKS